MAIVYILSNAITYLCVIEDSHLLNDPHSDKAQIMHIFTKHTKIINQKLVRSFRSWGKVVNFPL